MTHTSSAAGAAFRIWLTTFDNWTPARWNDVPPRASATRPAEGHAMGLNEAAAYLEVFNERMLQVMANVWAVPIRVALRYEGDLQPGQSVEPEMVDRAPLAEPPGR